jgi:hypothetical protein
MVRGFVHVPPNFRSITGRVQQLGTVDTLHWIILVEGWSVCVEKVQPVLAKGAQVQEVWRQVNADTHERLRALSCSEPRADWASQVGECISVSEHVPFLVCHPRRSINQLRAGYFAGALSLIVVCRGGVGCGSSVAAVDRRSHTPIRNRPGPTFGFWYDLVA